MTKLDTLATSVVYYPPERWLGDLIRLDIHHGLYRVTSWVRGADSESQHLFVTPEEANRFGLMIFGRTLA